MLKTGSRRCIVYLTSRIECDAFIILFNKICEDYHGWSSWANKIDCETNIKDRKEILDQFQYSDISKKIENTLHILASVRILDEAIDVPRCDSEFITSVGDNSSDIRTVQRLQRGGRLDKSNPSKINNLFIWAPDYSNALAMLSLLKDNDIEFNKKINILDGSYDKSKEPTRISNISSQLESLKKGIFEVKCLTREDKQLVVVKKYIAFVKKYKRQPIKILKSSATTPEKYEEMELYHHRKHWGSAIKNNGEHILYKSSKELLDNEMPGWSNSREERQHIKVKEIHEFYLKYKRVPYQPSKSNNLVSDEKKKEYKLGENLHTFKFAKRQKDGLTKGGAEHNIFPSTFALLDKLIPSWNDNLLIKK
jgi:superfamily II DNA or RNA helicase